VLQRLATLVLAATKIQQCDSGFFFFGHGSSVSCTFGVMFSVDLVVVDDFFLFLVFLRSTSVSFMESSMNLVWFLLRADCHQPFVT